MEISGLYHMGERFASLRIAKGLTQSQAAEAVGITEAQCGKIERGQSSAKLTTAIKFAELYDVTLDYLILGRTSEKYAKVNCLMDKMPDAYIDLVYEFVECIEKLRGLNHGE